MHHQFEPPTPALVPIKLGHGAVDGLSIKRVSWGYRKIPLSHGRHHIGRIVPREGHSILAVESVEERRVAQALAKRPQCEALSSQPVTIWYEWNGRLRRYTPDFCAWFSPKAPRDLTLRGAGRRTMIEVKPAHRALINPDTWSLLQQVVWTATTMPLILLTAQSAKEGVR
jgi:hypothetical protein